jgi:acyl-CoA synthetase (AMP-forming)/AMP-acid ligase II
MIPADHLVMTAANNDTLYDFMLGSKHEAQEQPWFIDALTGETLTPANVKARTDALALGLQACLFSKPDQSSVSASLHIETDLPYTVGPVISLISTNDVDYGTCVWASHKLGCTVAPSNAGSTMDELVHQLRLSGATAIIAHPKILAMALEAAHVVGISTARIMVFAQGKGSNVDERISG